MYANCSLNAKFLTLNEYLNGIKGRERSVSQMYDAALVVPHCDQSVLFHLFYYLVGDEPHMMRWCKEDFKYQVSLSS
jgi:hypothetical protein